jgi:hypothetical protein
LDACDEREETMADQSAGSGGPRWLREPPPGAAQVHIAIGDGAALTPEVREALEALAHALLRDDVEGYLRRECPSLDICNPLENCDPRTNAPCTWFTTCRISH